jgi:hypothetical protein
MVRELLGRFWGFWGMRLEGLAATYSPASWDAVPLALRVFTAEFGMGSGVLPLAVATKPSKRILGELSALILSNLVEIVEGSAVSHQLGVLADS